MTTAAIKLIATSALESASRTLSLERKALEALEVALAGNLAEPFSRAVELIRESNGRVIITGVGKSGHIGVKLAATLASTGTPAFFVHAAEASHGDLGMMTPNDVVLAISKGGESAELKSIISYTRRFSISLIAVTASEKSSLAQAADVVLLLPNVEEACPHGLAPTTSTMMQLAVGDALAIALLDARGFSARDFHVFHPGGKLGASLMHVTDIMHTGERVPLVVQGTSMPEAVTKLSQMRFGCVGVLDDEGRLCGIMTEGDLARNLNRNLSELIVDEVMTAQPKTVSPTALASSAAALLNKHNISALIVIDDDRRPMGLVHFHDLFRIGLV